MTWLFNYIRGPLSLSCSTSSLSCSSSILLSSWPESNMANTNIYTITITSTSLNLSSSILSSWRMPESPQVFSVGFPAKVLLSTPSTWWIETYTSVKSHQVTPTIMTKPSSFTRRIDAFTLFAETGNSFFKFLTSLSDQPPFPTNSQSARIHL